jgi:hypothetical protein
LRRRPLAQTRKSRGWASWGLGARPRPATLLREPPAMKMRLFALVLLCIHCEGRPKAVEPRPLAQEAAAGLDLSLRKRWLELEARQVHPKLEVPELNPASIEELRLAARAVARLSSGGARVYQEQLLRSDDPEVSGWSAFGLGLGCEGQERPTVEALALAAARGARIRRTFA